MLIPRRTKYRKQHRLRGSSFKGNTKGGARVSHGTYGLKALGTKELTSRQIEAARRAMTRHIKRGGKIWIKIFPHKPITAKSAEVPMGSGKGAVDRYTALVKPGVVIFEMDGVDEELARRAMYLAGRKLPIKTKFVSVNDI